MSAILVNESLHIYTFVNLCFFIFQNGRSTSNRETGQGPDEEREDERALGATGEVNDSVKVQCIDNLMMKQDLNSHM